MLASKYPIIADAAVSIREMTEEEEIRALCETREDYDRIERTWKFEIAELKKANDNLQEANDNLQEANDNLQEKNNHLNEINDNLQKELADANSEKEELLAKIVALETKINK